MTNHHMVKPAPSAKSPSAKSPAASPAGSAARPEPNRTPLPPMPAPEDSRTPTTREEPIDSPQPNASAKREAPPPGEIGLSTGRKP